MSERHTPLRLTRVDADTSVGSLAKAHDMHPDLFLAINTGTDPAGMFPGEELSERILSYRTVPLPRGRGPPPTVVAAAPAPVQPAPAAPGGTAAADGTGTASKINHDQRFGSGNAKSTRKRNRDQVTPALSTLQPLSSAPPAPANGAKLAKLNDSEKSEPAVDWNAAIGEGESCLSCDASANKETVVRAGTIVRVVSTFRVDRPSEFLNGTLKLDQHR